MWRVYSSPRFAIRHPREILVCWSQEDLDAAHDTLNLYDDLEREANRPKDKPKPAPKGRRARSKKAC